MRNIFYFYKSIESREKQLLLNDEGCSPLNIGYGYCLTSNGSGNAKAYAIVPVSSELSVVDRIFRDFIANKSITRIVTKLNEEQIPTRLKRGWNYNAVSNILKNENYIGVFSLRKYEIITANDSLQYVPRKRAAAQKEIFSGLRAISETIWNQAQEIRLSRGKRLSGQYRPTKRRKTKRARKEKASLSNNRSNTTSSFPFIEMVFKSLLPFASIGLPSNLLGVFRRGYTSKVSVGK